MTTHRQDLIPAAGDALRAERDEALQAAARLRAVLDNAHDAFISMDREGRITAWNAAAERLFGWTAEEALGRPATELMIPPRLHAAHEAGMARVRRTGVSALSGQRLELVAVDRGGREFPVEMALQLQHDRGEPIFHAFLRDITARTGRHVERRRAEELNLALASARRDFNRVIEQINDCVWSVRYEPPDRWHMLYVSPGERDVFGGPLPSTDTFAHVMDEHIAPEDMPQFRHYQREMAAGRPAEFECRFTGFDGVVRWVWCRGFPRTEGGVRYLDGIATNVTERRKLTDQRDQLLAREQEQVRRLRELDRMKDDLVAMVSHEMRNPIAIIAAYTESLALPRFS